MSSSGTKPLSPSSPTPKSQADSNEPADMLKSEQKHPVVHIHVSSTTAPDSNLPESVPIATPKPETSPKPASAPIAEAPALQRGVPLSYLTGYTQAGSPFPRAQFGWRWFEQEIRGSDSESELGLSEDDEPILPSPIPQRKEISDPSEYLLPGVRGLVREAAEAALACSLLSPASAFKANQRKTSVKDAIRFADYSDRRYVYETRSGISRGTVSERRVIQLYHARKLGLGLAKIVPTVEDVDKEIHYVTDLSDKALNRVLSSRVIPLVHQELEYAPRVEWENFCTPKYLPPPPPFKGTLEYNGISARVYGLLVRRESVCFTLFGIPLRSSLCPDAQTKTADVIAWLQMMGVKPHWIHVINLRPEEGDAGFFGQISATLGRDQVGHMRFVNIASRVGGSAAKVEGPGRLGFSPGIALCTQSLARFFGLSPLDQKELEGKGKGAPMVLFSILEWEGFVVWRDTDGLKHMTFVRMVGHPFLDALGHSLVVTKTVKKMPIWAETMGVRIPSGSSQAALSKEGTVKFAAAAEQLDKSGLEWVVRLSNNMEFVFTPSPDTFQHKVYFKAGFRYPKFSDQ